MTDPDPPLFQRQINVIATACNSSDKAEKREKYQKMRKTERKPDRQLEHPPLIWSDYSEFR